MLQHGLAILVGAHFEDIELVILAVGAPVVLRGLERSIHLVEPGADQSGVLGVEGERSAAAAVKAGGEGAVVRGAVQNVGLQHGQGLPIAGTGLDVSHGDVDDVRNVPAEADAVAAGLALRDVGGPLLGEGFGIEQAFLIQLVQPFHALAPALGGGGADDLLVVGHNDVTAGVGIAVAFAEAVAEDGAVLVAAADDAGERNDVAVDVELSLEFVGMIAEGNQDLFELIGRGGHLEAEEVQPRDVDEGHVSDGLDSGVAAAELLNPGQGPDVAVLVGAHGTVLRELLKDLEEVRHVLVDVVFQGDEDALLGVLQDIGVAQAGGRNEFGQGLDVGQLERDLVAPLVGLDGLPVDMDVGRLFETLVDGAVVGVRLGVGRESGQAGDLHTLSKGELIGFGDSLHRGLGGRRSLGLGIPAGGEQSDRHDESQNESQSFAQILHTHSPFRICSRANAKDASHSPENLLKQA